MHLVSWKTVGVPWEPARISGVAIALLDFCLGLFGDGWELQFPCRIEGGPMVGSFNFLLEF